jgi:hypothetical protein
MIGDKTIVISGSKSIDVSKGSFRIRLLHACKFTRDSKILDQRLAKQLALSLKDHIVTWQTISLVRIIR